METSRVTGSGCKVAFLDRDGVINQFPGDGDYVKSLAEFHVLPIVVDAIKQLKDAGWYVFIISNQQGVGKGLYAQQDLDEIDNELNRQLSEAQTHLDGIYYCTHLKSLGCDCRKPQIGNLIKALATINQTLDSVDQKFFVGDSVSDLQAGINAKCKTIWVECGGKSRDVIDGQEVKPDFIAKDLWEAVQIITQ